MNLKELMTGIITRTRYVHRWSTFHTLHKESVAEHSFFVALYVLVVGSWARERGFAIDLTWALTRAIVHDLDEAYSGDFIRSFKHSSPELKAALDAAASKFHLQICQSVAEGRLAGVMHNAWQTAKDGTFEGRLLAFCDFLSVASYAIMERQAGNQHISQESTHLVEYAKTFLEAPWDFLAPLPLEAFKLVRATMEGVTWP